MGSDGAVAPAARREFYILAVKTLKEIQMTRKPLKLVLAKETLHALAPASLRKLAGGATTPNYSCNPNCTAVCTNTGCSVCCHQ